MALYLHRTCSRCGGYLGFVVISRGRRSKAQALNGPCITCGYQLREQLIRGGLTGEKVTTDPVFPSGSCDA